MSTSPADPRRLLLTGRVVGPEAVALDGVVAVEGDRIRYAGPRASLPAGWSEVHPPEDWPDGLTLLPGLVDVHCHGGGGGEFGDDPDSARRAAEHHHAHGTTTVVGSLVSAPAVSLLRGAATLGRLVAEGSLAGVHLEGPFLSSVRCGAQDPAALVDADLQLLAALGEAAGAGGLAHMTWAPERAGGAEVPRALALLGALGSLGHTDADFPTAARALESVAGHRVRGGLPLVTHLFNGMPSLHHRAPGPAGAAIAAAARGEAVVEVIGDGVHLDGGTVRMVYDCVGPAHVALVSDAMAASGLPDGPYTLGGLAVTVGNGAARLTDGGSLAGGTSTLLDQVRLAVRDLGIDLADAVAMAATTPARALALEGVGALREASWADVVVVDDDLVLQRVLRRGDWL